MEYQTLLVEIKGQIGVITMNRPSALNALSDLTIRELTDAVCAFEENDTVRVVIITGAGKAFVAGADISYMACLPPEEARVFARDTTDLYARIGASRNVYIAAVNGFALGGGCEFALACDLRIASENARFGLPEVGLGILPGGGGTQRLTRLVGTQKAKEMILTGDAIKADVAQNIGLVCKTVAADELLPAAFDLAQRILKNPTLSVKYARECIQRSEELDLPTGIEFENALFGLCFATPDQREGMAAFLEKRKPVFKTGFQEASGK
jgi:enoyl-CoA hydratase